MNPLVWLFFAVTGLILTAIRKFLDSNLIARGVKLFWDSEHIVGDGQRTGEGVEVSRDDYGADWREHAFILRPTATTTTTPTESAANTASCNHPKSMIMSLHGGGWACANALVLSHSLTPFVRAGYTVYAPSYPLAPRSPYPGAVVSLLRALRHLKREHATEKVHLVGDSAGGNLATLLAALTRNPCMYAKVAAYAQAEGIGDVPEFASLPRVLSVTSIYGILDQSSWRKPIRNVSDLETAVCSFLYFVCLSVYTSGRLLVARDTSQPTSVCSKVTVADWLPELADFPPAFLVCGARDPLRHSAATVHWLLKSKGMSSALLVVPGARHAYYGVPPVFFSGLIEAQQLTTRASVTFLNRVEREEKEKLL